MATSAKYSKGTAVLLSVILLTWVVSNVEVAQAATTTVLICHIPPGYPGNAHPIVISSNAVQTHIDNHGDFLGNCPDDEFEEQLLKFKKEKITKTTELKKKRKILNDLNAVAGLKGFKNDPQLKEKFKEMQKEFHDLLKDLKENYGYDKQLKKELKSDLKLTKLKTIMEMTNQEKITKNKIDSKISKLSKSSEPKNVAKKLGLEFKNGKTNLAIKLSSLNSEILDQLNSIGKVTVRNEKLVQMILDVENIQKLSMLDGVEKIRPPFPAVQFEQIVSEGVYFINADLVQYAGITGKGIKVAVLDLAFTDNLKISENIVEVKSFRHGLDFAPLQGMGSEAKHGTAVAEIIVDVAPDIELFLYTMQTDIEFTAAIDEAISKDVDIIVMSAGWPNYPTDGKSHITKKVEEAISHDIVFVVPSGNFADKHWEGTYSDSNLNGWHEYLDLDEGLSIKVTENRISEEKPITSYLMWDDGMDDISDFDLVLVDPLGQIVDYSANEQITKNDTPFEYIHHIPEMEGLYALGIVYSSEGRSANDIPNTKLEIFTPSDELEHSIVISSVSVPTDASGAIVVGAVNHLNGELEPFSSQGPTNNGRLAPHVVGPDGVTTIALDGKPFFGTSATAPYVAGVVALLLETNPEISQEKLLEEIAQNTDSSLISILDEFDNAMGYGTINAVFLTQTEVVE